MADPQHSQSQPVSTQNTNKDSPPLTPPDFDSNGSDQKQSRKREREVSLEPANTPKASDADEAAGTEQRDTRTPAKRRALETTTEEAEEGSTKAMSKSRSRSHSVSPPIGIGVSPRQEIRIKVRQISQGVEDLNWKTLKSSDKAVLDTEITAPAPSVLAPPVEVDETPPESVDAAKNQPSQELTEGKSAASGVEPEAPAVHTSLVAPVYQTQVHVRSQSEGGEKGLKRRFGERGTSQGPNEEGGTPNGPPEPLKRLRDDEDQDPNPRVTKRQSPPPEAASNASPPPQKPAAKLTGFLAYASVSPFAAAKGPNILSSGKNTPASAFSTPPPATPQSNLGSIPAPSTVAELSTSPPKGLKRSGFEAFASSSSPFASAARSRSPVLGQASKLGRAKSPPARSNSVNSNPFASYLGNNQGFAVPAQKRARADSPSESSRSSLERNTTLNILEPNRSETPEDEDEDDRQRSFGEKLRQTRDDEDDSGKSEDEPKLSLTEQEVITGEEDDRTLHQVRSKLFSLDKGQWRERGTGLMKLNIHRSTGTARLVMRKEAVYALLLNVTLFPGMLCMLAPQDQRYLRFSAIEDGSTTHYNLRLGSAKAAQDLLDKILHHIPSTQ